MTGRDWNGDVLVIGAGPAGLAAAAECADGGLRVLLADENQRPGGQIDRRRFLDPKEAAARTARAADRAAGGERLLPAGVEHRPETVCHGFDDEGRAVLSRGGELFHAAASRVVLATGAVEKVLPLPGWTLPGVMTAGAAQTFLKGSGLFPYRKVLVAGSGPLLLAVAAQLVRAGVTVVEVAEAAGPRRLAPQDPVRALTAPRLLAQGAGYGARLLRAGVPVRTGTGVRAVEGDGRVTGARLGRLRDDWSFADGPGRYVECDAVLLNHGFTSSTELAAQRGARIEWDERRQTWRPVRDAAFRTTVTGVHAVGDCAGVGGVEVAVLEGRLAGTVIATELTGRAPDRRRVARRRGQLRRLETFRGVLDRLFEPQAGAASWPGPSCQLCRCQEVPRADADEALAHGAADLHALKLWTRAGMGACQGRICAPGLSLLLAAEGHGPSRSAPPSARFPVRPLPLGALCSHDPEETPS